MKSEKNRAGWPAGWPAAPVDEEEEEGLGLDNLDNFDRSMWDETEDEEVGEWESLAGELIVGWSA